MRRSSRGGDSDFFDDPRIRRERWDRDRFERMRRGKDGGGSSVAGESRRGDDDSEHFRFEEHDRSAGGRRDVDVREDRQRRGPMVVEKERIHEDERFDRRSRPDIFNEPTPSEVANQALAPYRRKSIDKKDINIDINIHENREPVRPARPARPGYLRRQSSLDIFDRRPVPRYAAIERYEPREYRPPANVPIPLPIRERHRSPRRYRDEEEIEDVRFEERGGRGMEREEFREVEVQKSRSRVRKPKSEAKSIRSSSSSSSEEEVKLARATWGKRGKTRLPKRLVKKQAIIELGYPYEEEDDFFVVTRALEKDHIDEIIKISENYEEEKMTYVYEDKVSEAPPPPSVAPGPPPPPPPPQEFYAVPPPVVMHNPPPPASHHAPSHYGHSERPPSPPSVYEHEVDRYTEIDRSTHVPHHEHRLTRRRSERDIREEIRSLELERRMLKYERDRNTELDIIETRSPRREVIRVDKDRKVRRDAKIIAAMMGTLT